MASAFVTNFTKSLTPRIPHPCVSSEIAAPDTELAALLHLLSPPVPPHKLQNAIDAFLHLSNKPATLTDSSDNGGLKTAIYARIVVELYAESLTLSLQQATEAESEADWWASLERSPLGLALYLLQTFPQRVYYLATAISNAIRRRQLSYTLAIFSPDSIRHLLQLGPGTTTFQLLFPYLRAQDPSEMATSFVIFSSLVPTSGLGDKILFWLSYPFILPYVLTQQECQFKRRKLEDIRDQQAERLGALARLRGPLHQILQQDPRKLDNFLQTLFSTVTENEEIELPNDPRPHIKLTYETLHLQALQRVAWLRTQDLERPSYWVRLWPKIVFLPPLLLYATRSLYNSRASLAQVADDIKETGGAFIKGWLLEPLKDVIRTVRAGGEEGVLVRQEAVQADRDSLERMTLALARDRLSYTVAQLESLSQQVREGDLTPVLRIYEDDIRAPLKSIVSGTLMRSIFIQVQKAKVDIDQALTGIDRLIRSQELTFAFVGVAPAFAIVYFAGNFLSSLWQGEKGRGKFGGLTKRAGAWAAMRRIERLLIVSPAPNDAPEESLPPLTSGLLLLSLASLRNYAETFLPPNSRLREGFLEDVSDLENPSVGRKAKLRVVDRMWRSWGQILDWSTIAAQRPAFATVGLGLKLG